MSTALTTKTVRIPLTATDTLVRRIHRAEEIRAAAIARADAEFAERVKVASEEHIAARAESEPHANGEPNPQETQAAAATS